MENKRVYTKATERLKRLHKEYGGLKSGNPEEANFFCNTDVDDNTGNFSSDYVDLDYFKSRGYEEVTEEEFIKFMNLEPNKTDNVNNPSHYTQGSIAPIDYIIANNLNFLEGNVVKYVTRYKHKNGLEDLKKAEFYLKKLISELESK